jgi:S1-C subfamily serine protease
MLEYKRIWVAIVLLVTASLACSLSVADRNETSESSNVTPVRNNPPTPISSPTSLPEELIIDADIEEQLLINIYERVNPAVVNIDVAANAFGELSDFGSGSGFVIDKEGHIVTNNHVVEDAEEMRVTFADATVAIAELVARDEDSDLAVIKVDVDRDHLVPLELGDSNSLRVGQRVIAIGNPWDLGGTMTVGIVSALGRTLPGRITPDLSHYSIPDLIQTDAAINPGNSGGPLLDSHGRVVGVNTAIRSEGRYNSGVGFAVPINIVKRVVPGLINEGYYRYPYLGIKAEGQVTVAELALELDLPVMRGVLVAEAVPGGPASEAGLRGGNDQITFSGQPVTTGGDIILAINDYELRDFDDLIAYLVRETSVGQEVILNVLRDGQILQIPVKLGERP